MITQNIEELEFSVDEFENVLFESFGDKFINDAYRLVSTNTIVPGDEEMIYEAMCIIVSMYMQKLKEGSINKDKVFH